MDEHDPRYSEIRDYLKRISTIVSSHKALASATRTQIETSQKALAKIEQAKATYDALRTGQLSIPSDEAQPF